MDAPTQLSSLDVLLAGLQRALDALAASETATAQLALDDAFAQLGMAYATLDPSANLEVNGHLLAVYDACLQHIGEAGPGRTVGLQAAIALLSPVRDALVSSLIPAAPALTSSPASNTASDHASAR